MHPQQELRQLLEQMYPPDRVQEILERTERAWESMDIFTTLQDLITDKTVEAEIPLLAPESAGERSPYLLIQGKGCPSRTVSLSPGRYSLGRHPINTIPLWDEDLAVSRMHCMITVHADKRIVIRDLSSRNGTFVNGEGLFHEGRELCSGDVIQVASYLLTLL